jgi:flagellar biogenesis protein FliO
MFKQIILSAALLLLAKAFAFADESIVSSAELGLKTSPVISFGYVIQLIFSLLIVIGILYAGARFILPRFNLVGEKGLINILDRKFMDAQSTAYILAVGKKKWLIVIAKGQVARIDALEE